VFAVIVTRTYRALTAPNEMVAVLVFVESNAYAALAFTVVQVTPSVLVVIDSVCVRAPQAGLTLSTTRPTVCADCRSTCTHWGHALFTDSQYVVLLASVTLLDTYVWL
jgi:hypothetical protein